MAGTVALQFLDTQSLTALCETGESVVLCGVWGGLCSRHHLPCEPPLAGMKQLPSGISNSVADMLLPQLTWTLLKLTGCFSSGLLLRCFKLWFYWWIHPALSVLPGLKLHFRQYCQCYASPVTLPWGIYEGVPRTTCWLGTVGCVSSCGHHH